MSRSQRISREEACRARIAKALGRPFEQDEFEDLMNKVQARTNRYRAAGETPEAAALRAGLDEAAQARLLAIVAKRQRYVNALADKGLEARKVVGDEVNTLAAAQGGSARGGPEYGYSSDAIGKEKYESTIRGVEADLVRADILGVLKLKDPQFESDFTHEMWHLEDPAAERPPVTNTLARKAAEIFHKHQEIMRQTLNDAGAWIGKLDHYVTRQSHDMWKIRAETYQAWRDFILPKLDQRTFDHLASPGEIEPFMRRVWEGLKSGVHEHNNGAEWLRGYTGSANLAKQLSQERVLHFKDAQSFFEYNQRFGHGSIIGTILHSLEREAKNYGAMKVFGTNPEAMIKQKREQWAEAADARDDAASTKIGDRLRGKRLDRLTEMLTGKSTIPEGKHLAQWGQTLRQWKTMTSLGRAMISSFNDIQNNASMLRHNGMPYFQSVAHQLMALLPTASEARRLALLEVYGGTKGIVADVAARYRAEDSRAGHLTTAANLEFKLNGLDWWTRAQRNGAGSGLAALWADHVKAPFDRLPPFAHNILKRYGLDDEGSWRALRQVATRDADGDHFLFPGEILNLPDSAVAHLGPNVDRVREDLRSRFGTLYSDQIGEAMSEPTLRQRATLSFGTHPGSFQGELIRSMAQFKAFTVTQLARTGGRLVFRGQTPMFGGKLNVDIPGLIQMMMGTTFFGGLSLMAKDLLGGVDPRSRYQDWGRFFTEAMAQGGGLGIYGDVLLGKNQYNLGLPQLFAGPVLGNLDEINAIYKDFRDGVILGDPSARKKIPSEVGRLAQHSTPYANLFWADLATKYLFFYGMQEKLNPGYLARMEQRSRHDKQTYWLRPTAAVRY